MNIQKAKNICEEFKLNLPENFEIASVSATSKIPFKALTLREALFHRVSDLSNIACDLYEKESMISAFIITRAIMETSAVLYALYLNIQKTLKNKSLTNIDDVLMKIMWGTKNDVEFFPEAYNVLGLIDKLTNECSDFRAAYNVLSEYTHPNSRGVYWSYVDLDKENYIVNFSKKTNAAALNSGYTVLIANLEIFKTFYNQLGDIFNDFILLCEEDQNQTSNNALQGTS